MFNKKISRIAAITLAGVLALSLAACGGGSGSSSKPGEEPAVEEPAPGSPSGEVPGELPSSEDEPYSDAEAGGILLGGWQEADSPVITEEMKALTEKAASDLVGATYTPVAYLASQVVSGTNHLVLCRTAPVIPEPIETYTFVTIYQDLHGGAQITNVIDTGRPTNIADLSGGWYQAESPEITEEIEGLCTKAFEKLTGVNYKPVALLSEQVVAGMNYCILCESTIVYPGADTTFAFVYLYKDLEGNVEVLDIWNCNQDGSVEGATIAE